MKKTLVALLLAVMLVLTSISAFADLPEIPEEYAMPISDGSITLSVYMSMEAGSEKAMLDYSTHPAIVKWSEATGINFTFIHPPANDDGSFFNSVIGSGELPDLFITGSFHDRYPGDVEGAIEDGILLNLDSYIEQFGHHYLTNAHNMWDETAEKNFKTDSGMFRFGAAEQRVPVLGMQHSGFVVRSDVMDELGLEMPKTIGEFHDLLVAFKEYGFEVPLALDPLKDWWYTNGTELGHWWNTGINGFMLDENDKVTHAFLTPTYKDLLSMLNQWYTEGLIDIDIVGRDHTQVKAMVTSGKSAMCIIGNWETQECIAVGKAACGEQFELKGMTSVAAEEGQEIYNPYAQPIVNGENQMFWGISTQCQYPEEAFKALDWLYSREGSTLMCFGPQTYLDMLNQDSGEEVTIYTEDADGKRAFTDYILHNDTLEYNSLRYIYTIQNLSSEYAGEMEYMQYGEPCNAQCWEAWTYNADSSKKVPSTISMTIDESVTRSDAMNDVDSYAFEHVYKIIYGEESVDEWDNVVEQLKAFGIEDAIAATQSATDRFNER